MELTEEETNHLFYLLEKNEGKMYCSLTRNTADAGYTLRICEIPNFDKAIKDLDYFKFIINKKEKN